LLTGILHVPDTQQPDSNQCQRKRKAFFDEETETRNTENFVQGREKIIVKMFYAVCIRLVAGLDKRIKPIKCIVGLSGIYFKQCVDKKQEDSCLKSLM
jgi:hypothetical protein